MFGDGAKGVCGDEVYCEREGGDGVVTEREWIDGGDGVLFHDGVEGACIDAGDGVVCQMEGYDEVLLSDSDDGVLLNDDSDGVLFGDDGDGEFSEKTCSDCETG